MLRNLRSDRSWFDCSVSPCDERTDVLENPTRPIRVEKELALNLCVGESVRGKERFPGANELLVRVVESICRTPRYPTRGKSGTDLGSVCSSSVSQL